MGISAGRAMVLLSTLAALVILVHSHEEEMESYRELGQEMESYRELGPGQAQHANNVDQSWRAVRSEPMAQAEDWEKNSPEEAPKRRRPGRKRKRRPLAAIHNEPEDRRFYHEEPVHPQDPEYPNAFENPGMPRRRRKRPEMRNNNWADQPPEQERPMRRRGQRRKRPIRPKQEEIEVFLPDEKLVDSGDRPFKEEKAASFINHKYDENDETYKKPNPKPHSDEIVYNLNTEVENKEVFVETEKPVEVRFLEIVEEKSVSDISKENDDIGTEPRPIEPKTLKDILKKSNGSSLSEILQQHNLSLTDLLHGKENAISLLKSDDLGAKPEEPYANELPTEFKLPAENDADSVRTTTLHSLTMEQIAIQENETTAISSGEFEKEKSSTSAPEILHLNEDKPKILNRRRYSPGGRRKLRLKTPMRNGTIKFPGNREYLSANARRLLHQNNFATLRVNATASSESNTISTVNDNTIATIETTTATVYSEETTTQEIVQDKTTQEITTTVTEQTFTTTVNDKTDDETKATTQDSTTTVEKEPETTEPLTETTFFTTEKVVTTPIVKPKPLNNSELRRQALTNRLKKKRLKQKTLEASTTEASIDNLTKDLYGMSNLVSASEFIAKAQTPKTTRPQFNLETTLEDFMATEASTTSRRTSHYYTSRIRPSKETSPIVSSSTEEIAKFEIEEILNDTDTGARLSKILIERNMTIDELVEHRERGSSNIHLADIFHNTSREPNHGEPFLSKSSIEPISRETYPLRALLEANSHEPKTTTMEPYFAETRYPNIPVVMDFGSNVNENGENLGIMSLFHKMAGDVDSKVESKQLNKDSEGTPYISTIISVNITNGSDHSSREGRRFEERHRTVTLSDIISMMHMNYNTSGIKATTKAITLPTTAKIPIEDADGGMVMENLQNLQDSNIAPESEENLELDLIRKQNSATVEPGILDKIPSHTKSVTVATASILGLSMVVFLLTYATFKWRQQRSMLRKKDSFCEGKIPSPVFESRKGTKNQSSMRSISPMISSTNIYTMSTLDSRNGKESPEYMWDSLRKPFQ